MKIAAHHFSHVGPRATNQDRVLAPAEEAGDHFIVAIADGVGGANGGERAALIATEIASKSLPDPDAMDDIFAKTVTAFRTLAAGEPEYSKMATTLSVALIKDYMVHVAHVGDSRIYHLRGSGLNTITTDQTEVAELQRKGVLTPRQAQRYPRRNVLLSALSPAGEYDIFRAVAPMKIGDRLLLLTDGTYGAVTRGAIIQASQSSLTVAEFVASIEEVATRNGPSDNYSALGIELLG